VLYKWQSIVVGSTVKKINNFSMDKPVFVLKYKKIQSTGWSVHFVADTLLNMSTEGNSSFGGNINSRRVPCFYVYYLFLSWRLLLVVARLPK